MDEPAEQLTHDLDCKFDIIVSMSTFEHVDSVEETMNSIYRMLHSGGVFCLRAMNLYLRVQKATMYG